MDLTKHSEKALKTIEGMNTIVSDWGLVEIKYRKEMVLAYVQEDCKTCSGNGRTYVKEGKALTYDQVLSLVNKQFGTQQTTLGGFQYRQVGVEYGECPNCLPSRGRARGYASTGKIWVWKKVPMMVGYPQWHQDTKFDSRFHDNDCQLCAKHLKKGFGDGYWHRYPITAKGADGVIHGMWIGPDCGKKFFNIKNFNSDVVFKVKNLHLGK